MANSPTQAKNGLPPQQQSCRGPRASTPAAKLPGTPGLNGGAQRGGMENPTCDCNACRPQVLPGELGMEESQLIAAARTGDEDAFAELYRRHCQYVRAIG